MSNWTELSTLLGVMVAVISIVSPILRLNSTVTKLVSIVDKLQTDMADITERNTRSHDRIWQRLETDGVELADHEIRITVLEKKE